MMDEQDDILPPALYDLQDAVETMAQEVKLMREEVKLMRQILNETVVQ